MGKLTKKDYIQIAEIVNKETLTDNSGFKYLPLDLFIESFADYLKTTNGEFNKELFKKACGVEK